MSDAVKLRAAAGGTASKSGFAKLVGVSPSRVTKYIDMGMPVRIQDERIDVEEALAWCRANVQQLRRWRFDAPATRLAILPGDADRAAQCAVEGRPLEAGSGPEPAF